MANITVLSSFLIRHGKMSVLVAQENDYSSPYPPHTLIHRSWVRRAECLPPTHPNSSFLGQESRVPAPAGQTETERKEGLVSGVGCCCGGLLVFTLGSDSIT